MKIALITKQFGQKEIELATRLSRVGHSVVVYGAKAPEHERFNGVRLRSYPFPFNLLHAAIVFRADVIHVTDPQLKRLSSALKFLRPHAALMHSDLPSGITLRRVSNDDVLLDGMGLRAGSYVAIVGKKSDVNFLHRVQRAWELCDDRGMRLAVVDPEKVSPSTLQAVYAGARAVVVGPSANEFADALTAMSYGRTVIAFESSALSTLSDYMLVVSDEDDLRQVMQLVIDDPMHTASLGHMARELVEAEYAWDVLAERLLDEYMQERELRRGLLVTR